MLTLQEIFDKGLSHIRMQGCASIKNQACVYRNPQGHACVVGGLIKDEHYNPIFDMNGGIAAWKLKSSWTSTPHAGQDIQELGAALMKSGVNAKDDGVVDLLTHMQRAHDNASTFSGPFSQKNFMQEFEQRMKQVALLHNLQYSEEFTVNPHPRNKNVNKAFA